VVDRLPRILLGVEGFGVAAAAVAFYFHLGFTWWPLAAFALVPDVAAIGYLRGPRLGAALYDAAHTYAFPLTLATFGVLEGTNVVLGSALIWLTHIGVDRTVGYGLKYTSGKDTHLQRI
jgi:hypothetical protein